MKAVPPLVKPKLLEISRTASRIYTEIIHDELERRGWNIADLAREANALFGASGIAVTAQDAYEWMEARDHRTSISKVFEWTLGLNLPPHCYVNAGKRA